ncbi:glucosyltransferase domain-containing protein [Harryflintia acetispora]|uniref:Glucosyltransferase GtrII-like protein n=1 Tax=Harryflintia acetispora TaxID=1849041 RepID=A0A9X8UIJ5_9FIRM|nr:glucosyltransferase domain-containing protein [Harryflintia acetispora]TCL43003.1 glucosyltransferase GtrII-like protein [Harryflintia acetispora]
MENILKKLQIFSELNFSKVSPCFWWAAGSSLVFGLFYHISAITGWIANWDVIAHEISQYNYNHLIAQGKPLFPIMVKLLGSVSIGSLNSLMAIFFISIASAILGNIFAIKTKLTALLMGAVLVTFPSVMCTFAYEMENVFFLSMLLAVIGTYFAQKESKRRNIVLAIIFITVSLLTYQAYIGVAAAVLIFLCIYELLFTSSEISTVFRKGVKYILILLTSCVLYYVILNLYLDIKDMSLSGYRGIDQMQHVEFAQIPGLLIGTYQSVLGFFFKDQFGAIGYLNFRWLYCIITLLFLVLIALAIFKNKSQMKPIKLLLVTTLILILPFGVHLIAVLGQNSNTHWLMKYPFVLIFVFGLVLAEKTLTTFDDGSVQKEKIGRLQIYLPVLVWALIAVQLFQWFVLTNAGYTRLRLGYEADYAAAVQIKTDLTNVEGFDVSSEVMFVEPFSLSSKDQLYYMQPYTGVSNGENFYAYYHFPKMMECYLGMSYKGVSSDLREEIKSTEEFMKMPCFPAHGYIKKINDVIVVKLGEGS